MALLNIIKAPDPILKKVCAPVAAVDDQVRALMDDMLVAVHKRVIVLDISDLGAPRNPVCMANPELVHVSDDKVVIEEGCLSFPEHFAEVRRAAKIRVRYLDYENQVRELEADGLLSTCTQHEMDHLDGILFVDYLSMIKRNIILRKMRKLRKTEAVGA